MQRLGCRSKTIIFIAHHDHLFPVAFKLKAHGPHLFLPTHVCLANHDGCRVGVVSVCLVVAGKEMHVGDNA